MSALFCSRWGHEIERGMTDGKMHCLGGFRANFHASFGISSKKIHNFNRIYGCLVRRGKSPRKNDQIKKVKISSEFIVVFELRTLRLFSVSRSPSNHKKCNNSIVILTSVTFLSVLVYN